MASYFKARDETPADVVAAARAALRQLRKGGESVWFAGDTNEEMARHYTEIQGPQRGERARDEDYRAALSLERSLGDGRLSIRRILLGNTLDRLEARQVDLVKLLEIVGACKVAAVLETALERRIDVVRNLFDERDRVLRRLAPDLSRLERLYSSMLEGDVSREYQHISLKVARALYALYDAIRADSFLNCPRPPHVRRLGVGKPKDSHNNNLSN